MQNPQSRTIQSNIEVSFRRAMARHTDMHALMVELLRLYTIGTERDRVELFGLVARDLAASNHVARRLTHFPGGQGSR